MSISTFNGLNIALRGLLTQQRALDVTSHNIANANTEGYTRQEAVLNSEEPLANVGIWGMIFPGQMGQGVTVDSYRRIRDVFNDTELRAQLARQAGADVRYRELSGIETAIPEPGENGIQALMTKFFANWQDVANNPENLAARQALAQQAQSLASAFNGAWTALYRQARFKASPHSSSENWGPRYACCMNTLGRFGWSRLDRANAAPSAVPASPAAG